MSHSANAAPQFPLPTSCHDDTPSRDIPRASRGSNTNSSERVEKRDPTTSVFQTTNAPHTLGIVHSQTRNGLTRCGDHDWYWQACAIANGTGHSSGAAPLVGEDQCWRWVARALTCPGGSRAKALKAHCSGTKLVRFLTFRGGWHHGMPSAMIASLSAFPSGSLGTSPAECQTSPDAA